MREARLDWIDTFAPPITQRLNSGVRFPKGVNVTLENEDVYNLMETCIFETLDLYGREVSAFCALFKDEEWRNYSYASDVDKYHNTGCVTLLSLHLSFSMLIHSLDTETPAAWVAFKE